MNSNFQKLLYVGLPLVIILVFFVLTNNNPKNQRENPALSAPDFESRLEVSENYPVETVEEINEFDTKVMAEGESEVTVKAGDEITVHYRGWLASDGTIFDQSFTRGDQGFTFIAGPTGSVIEGWQEGVIGMKVGEIRRLYIPSEKAYGEFGSGSVIGPDADLVFDVELIRINQ